jgi:filamentous hemagglutinin family protein
MSSNSSSTGGVSCSLTMGFIGSCLLLSALLAWGQNQVSTHITPDNSLRTTVTPNGRGVHTIAGGRMRGPNLFHSFDRFDVGTGDTARFTFTGSNTIDNIISRVTGGHVSNIDGTISSSEIRGANLYLLNPSGVVFGPHARLEVSGSFHVSTADVLRFADGYAFRAANQPEPLLTVTSPAAFGFLRANPAPIGIQRSSLIVPEDQTLSVVGGDIMVDSGLLDAPSGQIHLVSVASPGDVVRHAADPTMAPDVTNVARLGKVTILTISDFARINVGDFFSGTGSGTVVIRGGRLAINNARISADTSRDQDGAKTGVDIAVQDKVIIAGGATRIVSDTSSDTGGRAGNITVEAGRFTLRGGARITASTTGEAPAGRVTITATAARITGQNSGIFSSASNLGAAGGGPIELRVGTLTITDGGLVSPSTIGPGRGGTVTITAADAITIAGRDHSDTASGILSVTRGRGNAGMVTLMTPSLRLAEGGRISTQSLVTPNTDNRNSGAAGAIRGEVGRLTLTGGAQITSSTETAGSAGSITLHVGSLMATEQASITSSSTGAATGSAGRVTVRGLGGESAPARVVRLTNGQVRTSTVGQRGGRGDVLVRATEVILTDRATISAESTGADDAGNIRILDADTVRFQGQSMVTSEASRASGGNIEVKAHSLVGLREHSAVTAAVEGVEEVGGNIDMHAEVVLVEDSDILANAPAGRGGRITIEAEGFFADADSRVDASGGVEAGIVEIQALTDLSGVMAPLPQNFVPATALLRDQCAARLREGIRSSFVIRGRDHLPLAPEGVLPSPFSPPGYTSTTSARHGKALQDKLAACRSVDGGCTLRLSLVQGWQESRPSQAASNLLCIERTSSPLTPSKRR